MRTDKDKKAIVIIDGVKYEVSEKKVISQIKDSWLNSIKRIKSTKGDRNEYI